MQEKDNEVASVVEEDLASPNDQEILHLIQASTISLSKQKMQQFIVAQQTNREIKKRELNLRKSLSGRNCSYPQGKAQGMLYRVEDGHEQMFVLRSVRQKTMEEHHNVPAIGHVGV